MVAAFMAYSSKHPHSQSLCRQGPPLVSPAHAHYCHLDPLPGRSPRQTPSSRRACWQLSSSAGSASAAPAVTAQLWSALRRRRWLPPRSRQQLGVGRWVHLPASELCRHSVGCMPGPAIVAWVRAALVLSEDVLCVSHQNLCECWLCSATRHAPGWPDMCNPALS